ncbi:MAG: hypothetical protein AB7S50_06805 [Bacteroidales bacterium]
MKSIIKFFVLIMIAGLVFTSCEEDQYTEEEALEQQQLVDVVISILDASSDYSNLSGVTVKIAIDNEIVSDSTNSDGIVIFKDVKIGGNIVITASKGNYTSIIGEVSTNITNFRQRQVHETFYMYSLASDKITTVKGRLIYESDVTNRVPEPVVGAIVRVANNNLYNTNDQLFTGTTDATGNYEIQVPVNSNGDDYLYIYYPQIIDNQTVAMEQEDGTLAIVDREVVYNVSYNGFTIDGVPSIYATVPAPAGSTVGSGFALSAQAQNTELSWYSNVYIAYGGTGYSAGTVDFSTGANGNAAQANIGVDGNGAITSVNIVDNGAVYNTKPSLNISSLGGTGAVLDVQYQTTYTVYISNKGTGYLNFPKVSVEVTDYSSNILRKYVDDDINDNTDAILGDTYVLSYYSTIVNGVIYPDNGSSNADTILYTTPLASRPTFEVYNYPTIPAVLSISAGNINLDGTLASITIDDAGYGYDPFTPPTVTLNTIGGFGSGAVVKAEVNSSKQLSFIEVTNPGAGYLKNVNDFDDDGSTRRNPTYSTSEIYNVISGQTYICNADYGTGWQLVENE